MANTPSYSEDRRPPTPAQLYVDAVWESKHLAPNERLVCLAYANHAHEAGRPVDRSWVTTARLMERTGMSKGAVVQARSGAIKKGWLVDVGPRPGHKQIRVYRLHAPHEVAVASSSTPARGRDGKGRFTTEPVHDMDRPEETAGSPSGAATGTNTQVGAPDGQTSPSDEPVHDMDANRSTARTGTGPQDGPDSLTDSLAHSLPGADAPEEEMEEREEDLNEEPPPAAVEVPGIPLELARRVMAETTATAEELVRIVEAAQRDGVRRPASWLRSEAGLDDVRDRLTKLRTAPAATDGPPCPADYQASVRAACVHGAPGGAARCALCRRGAKPTLAAEAPPAEAGPVRPLGGQVSADQSIAAVRTVLDGLRATRDRRSATGPTHVVRPGAVPKTPPAAVAYAAS